MAEDDLLNQFGLRPDATSLEQIRAVLREHITRERVSQGEGDTEVMKLCCVQLFSAALLDDVLLIWAAKSASFDAGCSIDVQLLCGAGLNETKSFLEQNQSPEAAAALSYILECEAAGDFDDFSVSEWMDSYQQYYGVV